MQPYGRWLLQLPCKAVSTHLRFSYRMLKLLVCLTMGHHCSYGCAKNFLCREGRPWTLVGKCGIRLHPGFGQIPEAYYPLQISQSVLVCWKSCHRQRLEYGPAHIFSYPKRWGMLSVTRNASWHTRQDKWNNTPQKWAPHKSQDMSHTSRPYLAHRELHKATQAKMRFCCSRLLYSGSFCPTKSWPFRPKKRSGIWAWRYRCRL